MPARSYQSVACRTALLVLAVSLSGLVTATDARAQASISVTRLADMSFGDVLAGTSESLLYADAGASVFQLDITGMTGNQDVSVTLTLPSEIVNGAETVPISFGSTDAAWSYTNDPATGTAFDPSTGVTVAKNGNNFTVYVWIGASIDPDSATPSNQYSNSLTLDAEII